MRRRLLIAKALVHRPKVVFLDEPTAGVDVALRRDLWAYVRQLRAEGTTIVLTTHYLEEAEALADRVAVIDHGKLITLDRPDVLMQRHGQKRMFVTFARALAADVVLPPSLVQLGATLDEKREKLSCPMPERGLDAVLAELSRMGAAAEIVDVRTDQPSLEQVFLALTDPDAESA